MEASKCLHVFILCEEQVKLLFSTFILSYIIELVFILTGKQQTLVLTAPESRYADSDLDKQTYKVAVLLCRNTVLCFPTASMFTLKKQEEEVMEDGEDEEEDDFQTDEDEEEDEEMEVDKQVLQKRKKVRRSLK